MNARSLIDALERLAGMVPAPVGDLPDPEARRRPHDGAECKTDYARDWKA